MQSFVQQGFKLCATFQSNINLDFRQPPVLSPPSKPIRSKPSELAVADVWNFSEVDHFIHCELIEWTKACLLGCAQRQTLVPRFNPECVNFLKPANGMMIFANV